MDTFSFIESRAGSGEQPWHFDAPLPVLSGAPSVGLVAVVPLVDVSPSNGATEFLLGSHWQMADRRFWLSAEDHEAFPKLQPKLKLGGLALFDLGIRHRGRANLQGQRKILYMSYVQAASH